MAKFKKVPTSETEYQWQFMCLGCGYTHAVTERIHKFNQDLNLPSLSPSVKYAAQKPGEKPYCCHFFIKDGEIQYLIDCTHTLAGKTVCLPEII